jgi:hypothetical protein
MSRFVVLIIVALAAGGCSMFASIQEGPRACEEVHSRNRCLAMIDHVAAGIGKTRADVKSLTIFPSMRSGQTLSAPPTHVQVRLNDGTVHDARICGGVSIIPACTEQPQLQPRAGVNRDVPCAGPAPDGCATPLATFEPRALAAARPLTIADRTISIDHRGPYEIVLGEATLPNGVLTESSFVFDEAWPADVAIADGVAELEVRSLEPDGTLVGDHYGHGWRPGVERVEAILRFDVLWFEPGADLGIRDVIVR